MDIKANSLYQEMQAMAAETRMSLERAPSIELNPSNENFADMLSNAVNNVNSMQKTSRELLYAHLTRRIGVNRKQ